MYVNFDGTALHLAGHQRNGADRAAFGHRHRPGLLGVSRLVDLDLQRAALDSHLGAGHVHRACDMLGFTINFFTLLGMSLAIGIVVDDAIMVLENIVRHFHMGKTARQAALDGAREITFAATAATISVIAVFMPVLLVSGFVGVFLFQFGMTISTAVGLSLLEAITLTPMRCSQFMTAKEDEYRFAQFRESRLHRLCARPTGARSRSACDHRWKVVAGALGALRAVDDFHHAGSTRNSCPTQDIGVFIIRFQTPVGSSLAFTGDKAARDGKYPRSQPRHHPLLRQRRRLRGRRDEQGHVLRLAQGPRATASRPSSR